MELNLKISIVQALDKNPAWRKELHSENVQVLLADAVSIRPEFIKANLVEIGRL